jgi:hypothetical protein
MTGTILVLAKKPVPGRVKTRLCPPCTPEEAAAIAAAALDDTLAAVRQVPARHVIALDEPSTVDGFAVMEQRGAGLADRIANAFADVGGPALQIGMDTPQVTAELLTPHSTADGVLGPAEDGGWWVLGLRNHRHAELIRDVPMSTPDTGRLTLKALRGAGLTIELLPTLRDVDTFDDALTVAGEIPNSRFARTVRCTAR